VILLQTWSSKTLIIIIIIISNFGNVI